MGESVVGVICVGRAIVTHQIRLGEERPGWSSITPAHLKTVNFQDPADSVDFLLAELRELPQVSHAIHDLLLISPPQRWKLFAFYEKEKFPKSIQEPESLKRFEEWESKTEKLSIARVEF